LSICFIGPGGSCEYPWIRYALLRDNVLHHLEGGEPSQAFSAIYSIAGALRGASVSVSAIKLREELERARHLLELPIEELAISARTQAVISMERQLPIGGPTYVVGPSLSLPWISQWTTRLDGVFGSLLREILRITEGVGPQDVLEIHEA
jgi:hypothetical protein